MIMRVLGILLVLLLAFSASVPCQAGLNFSKKKETTVIKPSAKTFKKFQTKKYKAKKTKKPKKFKTKKVKNQKTRDPSEETLVHQSSTIKTDEPLEQDTIAVETKEQTLIDNASVEQVADQNGATVTKGKKPKKKKKATQDDINKFSKVRNGASEDVEVQQAGGE